MIPEWAKNFLQRDILTGSGCCFMASSQSFFMKLILGSTSPRRLEILSFFSFQIEQIAPGFDESQVLFQGDPAQFAQEVAKRKAICLNEKYPHLPVLTADTVVFQGGRLFLKPESLEEAQTMLSELSGKEHAVYTGVSIAKGKEIFSDYAATAVTFNELTQDQIQTYHRHFGPLDKAGAYAIQKGGSLIVKRIEGCYYNIMGLPLQPVYRLLLKVGINLWDHLKAL
jgi:septum formation protein